ncbi:MAG: NAD(P)/FAD-dependent oxidoreductase, partial [Clostridia bacterium]|nr:NAD(P)/FAD-dependent oxidoreductase [Clostridia bacterium]
VIGGGAAGIMASLYAAKAGARVTLLEKNEKIARYEILFDYGKNPRCAVIYK